MIDGQTQGHKHSIYQTVKQDQMKWADDTLCQHSTSTRDIGVLTLPNPVLNAAARVVTGTWKFWPPPGSDTARRTSLARRPRSGVYQAGSDSSPVSERLRTAVPVGLLRSGRRCWHSAAPARYVLSGFVDDVMFSHNGPVGHKGDVMFGRVRQVLPPDGGRASSLC